MAENDKSLAVSIQKGSDALMSTDGANHLWKMATMLSKSDIVPRAYQNKPENCLIAADYANRIGMPIIGVMQNLAIVNGRPSLEAKMVIALVNSCGLFTENLQFEVRGIDPRWDKAKKLPKDADYMVRAFATWKKTGRTVYGPWITWDMVMEEKWVFKDGSKWLSMPEQMFQYRAASFFQKANCPELTMGMQTQEEALDMPQDAAATKETVMAAFRDDPVTPTVEAEEVKDVIDEQERIRRQEIMEFGTDQEKEDLGKQITAETNQQDLFKK